MKIQLAVLSFLLFACQQKTTEESHQEMYELTSDSSQISSNKKEGSDTYLTNEDSLESVYGFIAESPEEAEKYNQSKQENIEYVNAVNNNWIENPESYLLTFIKNLKESNTTSILNPSGFIDLNEEYYLKQNINDLFIGKSENDFFLRPEIQQLLNKDKGISGKELFFNNYYIQESEAINFPEGIYISPMRIYPLSFNNLNNDQIRNLNEINDTLKKIDENAGLKITIIYWQNATEKSVINFETYLENNELKIFKF